MESNIENRSYTVRRAKISDTEQISEISFLSFPEYFSLTLESVRHIISEHPEVSFLVAECEGLVAGYIFTIPQDGTTDTVTFHAGEQRVAQIAGLAVHPSFRGKAIGNALVHSAMSAAGQFPDCRRIIAETDPNNRAAQSVLLKAGFTPIERLNGYYPNQRDAIRYERPLTFSAQPDLVPDRPAPRYPGRQI